MGKFIFSDFKNLFFWKFPQPILNETPMIKIIWILSFFFLTLFLIFFIVLILSRVYKNIINKRRERIKENLIAPFSDYLFDEEIEIALLQNNNLPIRELFGNKYKKNRFNRYVFREELLRLHDSYSGDIKNKLERLFIIFGFEKEIDKKLRSATWYIKANAISDASLMNVTQQASYILNLINYPNPIVRTEARVASIRLNKKNPFTFLNNIKYDLTEWDEIRIQDALMEYPILDIPLMGRWLNSKNESVVVFSLKIIGYYIQDTETDKVINCLNSQSENIKLQAIKTLGELGSKESLSSLFECLKSENGNKKMMIQTLQSIKLIGIFVSDIPKIIECLQKYDFDIIFEACLIIKAVPKGEEILKDLSDNADAPVVKIMQYALSN